MIKNKIELGTENIYEFIVSNSEHYPAFFDLIELVQYAKDDKMVILKEAVKDYYGIIGFVVLNGVQMKALYIAPEFRQYSSLFIPMLYKRCKKRSDVLTVAVDFNDEKCIERATRNDFKPTNKIVVGKDRPLEVYKWERH